MRRAGKKNCSVQTRKKKERIGSKENRKEKK